MKSNDWRHKNVARYTPGNTKILYFFNCLLDGMHTTIPYICDFSRCRLNVRLTACIRPLLRGHKYRVSALFGSCLLAAHANAGFILRKIWGRLQTVVTLRGVGILICHYNNSLCVNPTGFYSPNILYLLSSFSNPPTDFSSCQQAELQKLNKAYLWPRSKIWIRACISEYSNRRD